MNGYTSISKPTNATIVTSTKTCAARSRLGSATAAMTVAGRSKTGAASTSGQRWLNGVLVSVTGRPIPSSASRGGAVLVTLAERRTRQSILTLSHDKSAKAVKNVVVGALQPHAAHVPLTPHPRTSAVSLYAATDWISSIQRIDIIWSRLARFQAIH